MDEVDRNYDIDPSGERFLMITLGAATGPDSVPRIHVVLNWFEELKQRVPTGGR